MSPSPWIERKFPADTPLSMFPGLLERLRGTPARLEERLRPLAPALLTRRIGDTWSIQTTAGHLLCVESLWLGRLDDYAAGLEVLRPADMSNQRTKTADFDAQPLAPLLAGFRAQRAEVVRRLAEGGPEGAAASSFHPRLQQPMRLIDLMVFIAEHDDHHLARISEIIDAADGR